MQTTIAKQKAGKDRTENVVDGSERTRKERKGHEVKLQESKGMTRREWNGLKRNERRERTFHDLTGNAMKRQDNDYPKRKNAKLK